jgi:hypothetical protein
MAEKRNKKSQDPIREDPAYQKLLKDITEIVKEAKAKGVDFGARDDLFTCRHCGAYEDESFSGERMIMLGNRTRAVKGTDFIVLSRKEKSRLLKNGKTRFNVVYEFICGICGAHQVEKFFEDFDPL